MSTATIRSLHTLVALAKVDLGESALILADRIDEQSSAGRAVADGQSQITQIGAAFERLAQPGAPINPGALSVLARQSMAAQTIFEQAHERQQTADQLVDEQRQAMHRHQSQHDGLHDFLKNAIKEHAIEQDKKLTQEVEDLFLARRFYLGARA